ncbi:mitogen-activated protein kinase kinase kinase 7 isoform X1 [Drosophila ficusphila]|uniref:mitogen-activated protein kinase kinase kinase 7 isoform X1 n=1 Tax=Drosophila ficusphila TaxID=30025 RepID=UPI0007E852A6|nr:mitogen-activated protein kinase kinase kinase 7 isoform X1 [Drosophila ficusphila]
MASASLDALQAEYVDFSELTLREKVGHGSYGVVCKAVWRDKLVAVKEFFASAEQKDIEKEVKQLSRVKHVNIIALHGISSYQQATYLIMEYAEGGSLHNFLHGKVKPAYSLAHAMSWARQCAEGLAYLHAMTPKPLIHRDVKPLNLLLTNKGRNLKICDFGTVADKSTMMTNNRGSAAWMAPEVFEGSKYTEKCDIFSWAIVLWEVLSRKQPFKGIDNAYTIQWKIYKGERPPLLTTCPKRIEDLMTACWKTVPEERPSMQYIVGVMHEIVKDYTGADKALEYTFVNQQIVTKESDGTVAAQSDSLSSLEEEPSPSSTQLTPTTAANANVNAIAITNTSSVTENTSSTSSDITPTNSGQLDNNPLFHMVSNRWDAIPEEDSNESRNDSFNLTSSAEATQRLETIRNGMISMACKPMEQLTLDVEANGFDVSRSESSSSSTHAKSDGRERLTVTDTKPVILTTDLTNNNSNNSGSHAHSNGLLSHVNGRQAGDEELQDHDQEFVNSLDVAVDPDEDENDGTEQSLAEILDPELQPEPPIPNDAESQLIYREHRHMAKEYLSVDTNLYYAQDFKEKLIVQMDRSEREQKQELLRKIKDKEGLQSLYNNLQQQYERLPASRQLPALHHPLPHSHPHPHPHPHLHGQQEEGGALLPGSVTGGTDSVENDGWVVIQPHPNA